MLIIGGSLSGLTFALACARGGIHTRVLERVDGRHQNGGALAVDRALLLRVIGLDARDDDLVASFPVLTESREATAWHEIHHWLRELARRQEEIALTNGIRILRVVQNESSAMAITNEGNRIEARAIIGADGYRSVVRSAINPEQPAALYAGYLLWRGLVREADLPSSTRWPPNNEGVALVNSVGYRLIAYPVPGPNGSLKPGKRLLSFAWYDKGRDTLLQKTGCLSHTGQVVSSLSPEKIPRAIQNELRDLAARIWPDPWNAVIVQAIEQGGMFATPVAEYFPERLSRGRLAIIGDAAHIASPVVGQGFVAGILDAEALADALKESLHRTNGDLVSVLRIYEQKRLTSAREIVANSRRWSHAYLNDEQVPSPPVLERANSGAKQLLFRTRKKVENKT